MFKLIFSTIFLVLILILSYLVLKTENNISKKYKLFVVVVNTIFILKYISEFIIKNKIFNIVMSFVQNILFIFIVIVLIYYKFIKKTK